MIEVQALSKRYGQKLAVNDLSFTVQPGVVTGFLGPNGAGKSTTMRLILGLDAPSAGSATINGQDYQRLRTPLAEVGSLLEAKAVHTGRTGYNHLLALAQTHGIPKQRVDEVIEMVGLKDVAKKRVGGFSLGMGQRLGVASALLGDPDVVILDEPSNGLDPEGIRWIRNLLKQLASEGRTVFLSSHLMSEMQQTAEALVVIGRGKLIAQTSVADFVAQASAGAPVRIRSADQTTLAETLTAAGASVRDAETELIEVTGLSAQQVGDLALENRIALYELTPLQASLEDAYMSVTEDSVEYRDSAGREAAAQPLEPQPAAGESA